MAFTVAQVANPAAARTVYPEGPFKVIWLDLTFDSSYDNTNGETISASTLGVNAVVEALVMRHPRDATNKLAVLAIPTISADYQTVTFRCEEYNGASAGVARFQDVANAADLSLYTMRVAFYCY